MAAFRQGNWKALRLTEPYGTGGWQLYDLTIEPAEKHELAAYAKPAVGRKHDLSRKTLFIGVAIAISLGNLAHAQSQTLASTLEVSVFPAAGQDSTQQSKDEAECYSWAVDNSGSDPFELTKQQEAQKEQTDAQIAAAEDAQRGGGVIRGAAAGAVIGEVTGGDAGESAAIGAAVGAVGNRRRNKRAQQQAAEVEQYAASTEQATDAEIEKFMNGFTACLEAKDYVAKY